MNRALLKQDAKNAMRQAQPHPVLVTLVYLAIAAALSAVALIVASVTGVASVSVNGTSYNSGGEAGLAASLICLVVGLAAGLVSVVLEFGYICYSLKVFKQEETGFSELWGHFPMILKVFGLTLWIVLFVYLWSLLCVIPGIIAGLRYSQAFFILAENPDMSIRECVNKSKTMMSGKLWEYFVLNLSFILWHLLVSVTCGIATIYATPYVQTTLAGYYLSLKPATDPAPAPAPEA